MGMHHHRFKNLLRLSYILLLIMDIFIFIIAAIRHLYYGLHPVIGLLLLLIFRLACGIEVDPRGKNGHIYIIGFFAYIIGKIWLMIDVGIIIYRTLLFYPLLSTLYIIVLISFLISIIF